MRIHRIFLGSFFALFSLFACEKQKPAVPPDPEIPLDLSACLTNESSDTLEIMTWNIEHFPISSEITIGLVKQIIEAQQPDVVAFQEISSITDFNKLTDELTDYESQVYITGDLNLGFMYKLSEITVTSEIVPILDPDTYVWPRQPILMGLKHTNGISTNLITLHLKCCDGLENYQRRRAASEQLKLYIDGNLPNEPVIVLGDFNDEIYGIPEEENPFMNFIADTANYVFADMNLAKLGKKDWSYPSWPSHIDHILITNELFVMAQETLTLSFDNCFENYGDDVSDHRPVMIKLTK